MKAWLLLGDRIGVHALLIRNALMVQMQKGVANVRFWVRWYPTEMLLIAVSACLGVALTVHIKMHWDQQMHITHTLMPSAVVLQVGGSTQEQEDFQRVLQWWFSPVFPTVHPDTSEPLKLSDKKAQAQPLDPLGLFLQTAVILGLTGLSFVLVLWITRIPPLVIEQSRCWNVGVDKKVLRAQSVRCIFYQHWRLTEAQMKHCGLGMFEHLQYTNGQTKTRPVMGRYAFDDPDKNPGKYCARWFSMACFFSAWRLTQHQRERLAAGRLAWSHHVQLAISYLLPMLLVGAVCGTLGQWIYEILWSIPQNSSATELAKERQRLLLFPLFMMCMGVFLVAMVHSVVNWGWAFAISRSIHGLGWKWVRTYRYGKQQIQKSLGAPRRHINTIGHLSAAGSEGQLLTKGVCTPWIQTGTPTKQRSKGIMKNKQHRVVHQLLQRHSAVEGAGKKRLAKMLKALGEYLQERKVYGWRGCWYPAMYTGALMVLMALMGIFAHQTGALKKVEKTSAVSVPAQQAIPVALLTQHIRVDVRYNVVPKVFATARPCAYCPSDMQVSWSQWSSIQEPLENRTAAASTQSSSSAGVSSQWVLFIPILSALMVTWVPLWQSMGGALAQQWDFTMNFWAFLLLGTCTLYAISFVQTLWYWLRPGLLPYYQHYTLSNDSNVTLVKSFVPKGHVDGYLLPHHKSYLAQWSQNLTHQERRRWVTGAIGLYALGALLWILMGSTVNAIEHWVQVLGIMLMLCSAPLGYVGYVGAKALLTVGFIALVALRSGVLFVLSCLWNPKQRTVLAENIDAAGRALYIVYLGVKNGTKARFTQWEQDVRKVYLLWCQQQMQSGAYQQAQKQWLELQVVDKKSNGAQPVSQGSELLEYLGSVCKSSTVVPSEDRTPQASNEQVNRQSAPQSSAKKGPRRL